MISWQFPKAKEQSIKGFHLLKSSVSDFQKVALLEKEIRSYRDTDFIPGQEYHYKIISESLKGITNDSMILILKPQPPPPTPGMISFTIDHDMITLTWERSDETSYFNIYKSTQKGEYALTPLNSQPLKEPTCKDSFDINRTVFYTVRSSTGSTIRDEGPPSEELTVNPLEFIPSSPQYLVAVPTSENVYLIWKEPSETWVIGYRVYRELYKQEGYILIGSTYTPSFVDNEKITRKRNYKVTALGPSKEGPPAEIRDVMFEPPK